VFYKFALSDRTLTTDTYSSSEHIRLYVTKSGFEKSCNFAKISMLDCSQQTRFWFQ